MQPPSPTGSFTFSSLFTDLPGVANTGTPPRQLPARAGAAVLHRPAAGRDSQPRPFPGVLHPGRLARARAVDGQCRSALHAELSLDRGERPERGLQSRHPAPRVPGPRRPSTRRPPAAHRQLRPAARHRQPHHRQDRGANRLRPRVDRTGRDHHTVHDAVVSLPADRLAADARQRRPGLRAGDGPERRTAAADANRRHRTGRASRSIAILDRVTCSNGTCPCSARSRPMSRSRSPTSDRRSPTSASPIPI